MVVTRSAAKKLAAASQQRGRTRRTASPAPGPSKSKAKSKAAGAVAPPPGFHTTFLKDSSVAMVTVEPSATGQGIHTRWIYRPPPGSSGKADDTTPASSPSSSASTSPASGTTTPPHGRFVTPAPRDSFYANSALRTPRARAKPHPRRVGALTNETARYKRAMQDAMNTHGHSTLSHPSSSSPPTPTAGRSMALAPQESRENVFNPTCAQAMSRVSGSSLGQPVSLHKAPLDRYDTIRWDEGCGESADVPDQQQQQQQQQQQPPEPRASPLARCTDTTVKPLLGPEGTQLLGPQGTHLLLGATAGPIYDTQIITPEDSMADIEMDAYGQLKGPIGPNGEKLSPDGRPKLGPTGTFLHYDVNRLMNRLMDQRIEAFGFVNEDVVSPPRMKRLGPQGTELLE